MHYLQHQENFCAVSFFHTQLDGDAQNPKKLIK